MANKLKFKSDDVQAGLIPTLVANEDWSAIEAGSRTLFISSISDFKNKSKKVYVREPQQKEFGETLSSVASGKVERAETSVFTIYQSKDRVHIEVRSLSESKDLLAHCDIFYKNAQAIADMIKQQVEEREKEVEELKNDKENTPTLNSTLNDCEISCSQAF